MPVPRGAPRERRPARGAISAGLERAMFGLGCFWGAERKFWELPGVYTTAVGYAAGSTPNPTYREVCSGMTGHAEVVLVVFDPEEDLATTICSRCSGRATIPRRGCGRATTSARSIGRASTTTTMRSAKRRKRTRDVFQQALRGGLRRDHHRDSARAGVLLRRGLSPAVPVEESGGLLRSWRHRRLVPGGPCGLK